MLAYEHSPAPDGSGHEAVRLQSGGPIQGDGRQALPEGTILDGCYEIKRVVGVGGFAITYEAIDANLATSVAVKEYYPAEFGQREGSFSVRPRSLSTKENFDNGKLSFLREARTLARFNHPNIVRVVRVFEANDTAYIIMRFERGSSFEGWLNQLGRRPDQQELDGIVTDLLSALEEMHHEGLIHRDIAPDNIIIRADGTPVLLDFGAVKRGAAEYTRTVAGIVKLGYSPQEQYSVNSTHQGPWSDLYALGGSIYRAISGYAPPEAPVRFGHDTLQPAAELGAGQYRHDFLSAVDWCLKLRPVDRPQSVADLRSRMGLSPAAITDAMVLPQPAKTGSGSLATVGMWMLLLSAGVLVASGAYLGVDAYMNKNVPGQSQAELERQKAEQQARQQKIAMEEELRRQSDRQRRDAEEELRQREQAEALDRQKRQADEQRIAEERRRADEEEKARAAEAERRRVALLETEKENERRRREAIPTPAQLTTYSASIGTTLQRVQCFAGLNSSRLGDVQKGLDRFSDRMHSLGRQGPDRIQIASANVGRIETWLEQTSLIREQICPPEAVAAPVAVPNPAPPRPAYVAPAPSVRRPSPGPVYNAPQAPRGAIMGIQ